MGFELGRPMASTKLGAKHIHLIRTRGGNEKRRALRLEQGNFSWGSEVSTHKTRILDVVYNASDNDLLRTKTLVKNAIVQVDATPFKLFYVKHYGLSKDFSTRRRVIPNMTRRSDQRSRSARSKPHAKRKSWTRTWRINSSKVVSWHASLPVQDKAVVPTATFSRDQSSPFTRGS